MVRLWRCGPPRPVALATASITGFPFFVSQEDVRTRLGAWRGIGAWTASRFMAGRALSRGAKTDGAVCAEGCGTRAAAALQHLQPALAS